MKTSTIFVLCILVVLALSPCHADEMHQGRIIGNMDGKVKILLGDRAIIDLGEKNGLIKGDIVSIYNGQEKVHIDPIGKCAVTKIYEKTSVCDIFKMSREVGADVVMANKTVIGDADLYPVIFKLLTATVEPYKPQDTVKVFIHTIVDDNKNVTKFSEYIRKEIKHIYKQKKRIDVVSTSVPRSLAGYLPTEYADYSSDIKAALKKEAIDVIIGGKYSVKGDKVEVLLFKVDQKYNDIEVGSSVAMKPQYSENMTAVVTPYSPIKKEKSFACNVIYNPVYYSVSSRDMRRNVIEQDSKHNPFLENNLKRVDFNIVSPVDFKMTVDNTEMSFDKKDKHELALVTGVHNIKASFKKGYFYNDTQLIVNEKEIEKNIVISVDKAEDLIVEAVANPIPGKENIEFKVYQKAERSRPVIKSVLQKDTTKQVETFRD